MAFRRIRCGGGLPKAIAAARGCQAINSACEVTSGVADLTACEHRGSAGGRGLILDGTDNFETRYLVNDFAVSSRDPLDLRSGRRQLRADDAHSAGRNRLSELRLSEPPGGRAADLRNGRRAGAADSADRFPSVARPR